MWLDHLASTSLKHWNDGAASDTNTTFARRRHQIELHAYRYFVALENDPEQDENDVLVKKNHHTDGSTLSVSWSANESALFDTLMAFYGADNGNQDDKTKGGDDAQNDKGSSSNNNKMEWIAPRVAAHFPDRTPADVYQQWYHKQQQKQEQQQQNNNKKRKASKTR
jgi:hypothetical protein